MASWRRTLGNTRSFTGNATGGLQGGANLASRAMAGTLAYLLSEKAALAAASDPYRYIEKRKPIPDPQEIGFVHGIRKGTTKCGN